MQIVSLFLVARHHFQSDALGRRRQRRRTGNRKLLFCRCVVTVVSARAGRHLSRCAIVSLGPAERARDKYSNYSFASLGQPPSRCGRRGHQRGDSLAAVRLGRRRRPERYLAAGSSSSQNSICVPPGAPSLSAAIAHEIGPDKPAAVGRRSSLPLDQAPPSGRPSGHSARPPPPAGWPQVGQVRRQAALAGARRAQPSEAALLQMRRVGGSRAAGRPAVAT
jgi:hypothetical protein